MKLSSVLAAIVAVAATTASIDAKRAGTTNCDSGTPTTDASAAGASSLIGADGSNVGSATSSSSADGSVAALDIVPAAISCADLASIDLTDIVEGSSIESVAEITSGGSDQASTGGGGMGGGGMGSGMTPTGSSGSNATITRRLDAITGYTYCQVNGKLDTNVTFTVMLPKDTWTQRLLFSGCGGLCGSDALSSGSTDNTGQFALAATDMAGGTDGTFGLSRERRLAFAYRANHWVTVAAKKLIKSYYGQAQKYAYFSGCSDGGREAVMEALRYPDDFNGIIAGAPAFIFTIQNSLHHGWLARSNTGSDGTHPLIGSRLSILHSAVVAACDKLDGVEDGLVSEPRLCDFDAATIQCASDATNTTACLTAAEVETITKIYQGPVDATTGEHLTVGEAQYGSELAWQGVFVPTSSTGSLMSEQAALAALKYLVFEDTPSSDYTIDDLEFTTATLDKLKARHPLFDAISPDLSAFHQAGGKLILYHGWADPHISPRGTIAFHEALRKQMGEDVAESFQRLYLLPGVYHCGDGEGFSTFDFVTPMQKWIESGVAPDAVVVSSASTATVTRSRPLYPYPAVPKYTGTGDINAATSYAKGSPLYTKLTASWAGDSFFTKYTPIEG